MRDRCETIAAAGEAQLCTQWPNRSPLHADNYAEHQFQPEPDAAAAFTRNSNTRYTSKASASGIR